MGNSYKNCKIQDNTAELIYENGSLFVTIFENNIVHVAQKPGIESVAIEESFIPKAATPNVTCKDTSDAKGNAAEAGVSDAAVKANIVSPISIIIVAISGLTSFAIPNFSLELHFRLLRFLFIFLAVIFGFLGLAIGIFVYLAIISSYSSFGIPYLSPYIPLSKINNEGYFLSPFWKREKREDYLNTKRVNKEAELSMKWRQE